MMHARSLLYTISREIASFLSVAFLLIPGRMSGQNTRALMPPCDSVVVDDGQGHRSVTLIPQVIPPEKAASRQDNVINEKQLNSPEDIMKEHERRSLEQGLKYRSLPSRDLASYATGSIPIEESVSPFGGRVYRIPIATASGWSMAPNISLVYNSQGGNNVAGYGWGLSGLSLITVRNSNMYYDGVAEAYSYSSPSPKYSLDGEPIVQSEMGITGYSYTTAKGNIQIKINHNQQSGRVESFNALYPNGSTAVFGFPGGPSPRPTYPMTEFTDKDGNTISFTYGYTGNTYYITAINYGDDASINFVYTTRTDTAPYQNAYFGAFSNFPFYLLKSVTSCDGNNTICQYSLTHEEQDGVNLLKEVHCTSGTSELPPLVFTYGIDSDPGPSIPRFGYPSTYINNNSYYVKSSTLPLMHLRGKMIPCRPDDGIVILPSYSTYALLERTWLFGWCEKYGSSYNANQSIICNFTGLFSSTQRIIPVGEGFQKIEVVDVDGDGVDEIVKINNWSSSNDITTYQITIYSFDTSANVTGTSFSITVNDGSHNALYKNPAKSYYHFGDFRGNGKTMLLIMTENSSKFALVDLYARSKLSESSLYTLNEEEVNLTLVADFEGDGKADLCHITDDGMKAYSLLYESSTSFSLRKTYSGVSKSILYNDFSPDFTNTEEAFIQVLDFNGDGYQDIAAAPGYDSSIGKFSNGSSSWNIARFNGIYFSIEACTQQFRDSDDTIMFLDLDKDGLPEMIHQNDTTVRISPNAKGKYIGFFSVSGLSLDSTTDIIPGCGSAFGRIGDFIVMSGPITKVYRYSLNHSILRSLETMTDSFGIVQTNMYGNTGESDGPYMMDSSRTYSAVNGFKRIHNPLSVLCGSTKFMSEDYISSVDYYYYDEVYHCMGLGFCGFGKIIKLDYTDPLGFQYTTTLLNPEKFGVVEQISLSKSFNGTPFSSVINTYDSHSTAYGKLNPRLTGSVSTNSLTGVVTTTACSYGRYDFPKTIITRRRIGNGTPQTDTLRRVYVHSITASKFVLGAVTEESITTERDGADNISWKEKTVFTYDSCYRPLTSKKYVGYYGINDLSPLNGLRHHFDSLSIIGPELPGRFLDATNLVSETHWQYDSHGHVISETTAPYGATEYTGNAYTYDSNGRYLLTSTDALGHTTTYSGYNKFGKPATVTDYRGRITTYTYDSWGNVVSVSHPDNSVEQTTVAWGGVGLYTVTITATGQPESVTHYDALAREIRSGVKRFNGQWQWVDREYNGKGLLKRISLPYRGPSATYWNDYTYDIYNRPDSIKYASGKVTAWSYSGTGITTVKDGITSTQTTDASGNVVSVTDAGGTITYTLRDDGQPSSITAPGNVSTTFAYDDYGRRTRIVDPSAGTQTDEYLWNSNGTSRVTHTNPNGTVKTYRDKYGRITLIERPGEYNTAYTYDAYGRLSTESSTNGTGKEYTYDGYDRVIYAKESVPDNKWLEKEYTYSPGGVLSSVEYTSQAGYITTEIFSYSNGYNTGITLPGGAVVLNVLSENDLGMPTYLFTGTINRAYGYTPFGLPIYREMYDADILNFSYQFDPLTGNLLVRGDGNNNQTETFGYDNLNRLTSIGSRQITYAANGNILSMDGVGTMAYSATGRPYQITSLTPASSGLVQGRQQNVSYTSYNRPSLLTEGGRSATFTYNGDGDRVKMNVADSTGNVLTRYYIGGSYECDLTTSGTKERLYLGGDAYSAPMVYQRENNGSWTLYNIGRDYLGSITHIATADGTLVAEYSYDPWGRLRDPETLQNYAAGSEPELFLGRGYTGHEHLTWFGLINMNARLYDPLLGRFLSPDPYVQAPDFTQNFNRYSYALNNPLKYSDESGDVVGTFVTAFVQFIVAGGKSVYEVFSTGFTDKVAFQTNINQIWSDYDQKVTKAAEIDAGMFKVDEDLSFWQKIGVLGLRFTWELPNVLAGNFVAHFRNNISDVNVEYYRGATLVNRDGIDFFDKTPSSWGFTLGSYINSLNVKADPEIDDIFAHEYGHTFQSRYLGPFYFPLVGVPSFLGECVEAIPGSGHEHDNEWYEVWANNLSADYFDAVGLPGVRKNLGNNMPFVFHPDLYFGLTLWMYGGFMMYGGFIMIVL